MSKASRRQPSPGDSDYEGAWKDALRGHFRELLEKYFPAAAETIDWQHPPQRQLDRDGGANIWE